MKSLRIPVGACALLAIALQMLSVPPAWAEENYQNARLILRVHPNWVAPFHATNSFAPRALPPATNDTWLGGVGNWSNATLWSAGVPGSGSNVLIDNGNAIASTVNLDISGSAFNLVIDAGDTLHTNNATILTLSGTSISNAGALSMNSIGNATELVINSPDITLSGPGKLTLSNNGNNFILGGATADTLTNQSTIQGSGNIGDNRMTLVNAGLINANQSVALTIAANGSATNTGTLEATAGGTLGFSGTTVTNTSGTINTSGGVISGSSATINGGTVKVAGGALVNSSISGATVTVSGTSDLTLNNSTIINGTLTNGAQSTIETVAGATNALGGTVTNPAGGTIKVDNATFLTLNAGTYSNAGTISMNSIGNATELILSAANTTLTGGGAVTMSNNVNNFIFGAATADILTNQETIQGSGNIGNGRMTLVNAGVINANQSAALTIAANGGTTNTGTMKATGGGTLGFSGTTVTNTGGTIDTTGGTISASTATINNGTVKVAGGALVNSSLSGANVTVTGASDLTLNNSTIINGTLANSTQGTIETVSGSTNALGGTVTNPAGGAIKVDNATFLTLNAGTYTNAGTISMNSTGNFTELIVNAPNVTLAGGGTLTMSNNVNNFVFGTVTADTLTNQETIQGSGNIGNGRMTLVNSGLINANQSAALTIAANGGTTNTGTMKATAGGTLGFSGTTVTNTGATIDTSGGTISASNSTINGGTVKVASGALASSSISGANVTVTGTADLTLNNSTIINGTLANSAQGTIETISGANNALGGTVTNPAGGTIKVDNATFLTLQAGTYTNAGTISLNSIGNFTDLIIDALNVTLTGGGTLTLSNNANNIIIGSAIADTLTNQETIQGSGNLGDNQMTLVNSGLINANQTAALTIAAKGGTTNTGTMKATSGGTLGFSGTVVTNTGGTVDTSGGAISASAATINGGTVKVAGGALATSSISGANVTVTGAANLTLNNSSIINGTLTNSAQGTIETISGATSALGGTVTNPAGGTIKVDNATFLTLQAGTYTNAGTISLNSTGNFTDLIISAPNVTLGGGGSLTLSNNANNIIIGSATADTLTNQETIQGSGNLGDNQMTLVNSGLINANQSAPLTIAANGGATNTGTIKATAGGALGFSGTVVTNTSGTVDTSAGTISASNSTINGGTVKLASGALAASSINGANVSLTGAADLTLNNSTVINGTLANSAQGTIETISGTTNAVGGTVTNPAGGTIKVDNATSLTLQAGTYTNAGTISLNSIGNFTDLIIGAPNVTLGGGGTLTMSNNTNNIIIGSASVDTLTNQETIQGSGNLGDNQMTLVNNGTINANQSAALTIAANGGTTNTGLMEATAGGTLAFSGTTVTNTGGTVDTSAGTFLAGNTTINGGTVTVAGGALNSSTLSAANVTVTGASDLALNNGLIVNGSLTNSAQGTIEILSGANNALGGTVTNPAGGTIQIDNTAFLTLQAGTYNNAGTISLNSIGNFTDLIIGAPSITLGGTINMSNNTNNLIIGAATADTLTNQGTIQGSGNIGDNRMTLVNAATGTISANQSVPLVIGANGGFNNLGTLLVNSGDLMQIATTTPFQNFSGTTLTGGSYNIQGGTLQFPNANIVTNAANISLSGAGSQIISNTGADALANFAVNAAGGSFTLGPARSFTTAGNFTNTGKLTVGTGDIFKVSGNLSNFSGTTLTGGTYAIGGTLQFGAAGTTSIVTDAASISLTAAGAQIQDLGGNNALAGLAVIAKTGSFTLGSSYGTFTTAGRFTNNGLLSVGAGDSFIVNGNLTNFAAGTLTGGRYTITGTLRFNGAAVATNAATITLAGAAAKIVNQSNANALLGFITNTGTFALSGAANLSTSGGSFTNSGAFTVGTGSLFTVGGASPNFTQTAGTTTVDGTLTSTGAGMLNLNGGSLFGAGTVNANVVDASTLSPGDSATKTGMLTVADTYSQSTAGMLDISIGGTTVGAKYDELQVNQSATLNGTLNVSLVNGFTPKVGQTFTIVNAASLTGTFATVNGLAINASEHFSVSYNGTSVVLTVVSGALGTSNLVTASVARPVLSLTRPVSVARGHFGREVFRSPSIIAIAKPAGVTPHTLRPRDEMPALPAVTTPAATASAYGVAAFSAANYNSMASMNHMRFECGIDLKAALKVGRKQWLKSLVAAPDSADALSIGYMVYGGAH